MQTNLISNNKSLDISSTQYKQSNNPDFANILNQQLPKNYSDDSCSKDNILMLGTITKDDPTVSNILIKNSVYGKECWNIIYSKVNNDKLFNKIQAGTKIYINPETRELLWGKEAENLSSKTNQNSSALSSYPKTGPISLKAYTNVSNIHKADSDINTANIDNHKKLSENLVNAVKSYIGKSYNEVDCYQLVVNGLKNVGIKYKGSDGLGAQLINMAVEKGLPENAYINGEGLIKASGSEIYSKVINKIDNYKLYANQVISELTPLLEQGQILSFSTRTKGHTGVISKKDDTWTFINSGRIDNNVEDSDIGKGVGEEILENEIMNWFKVAAKYGESLQITVGMLDENKLALFNNQSISQKV